MLSVVSRQGSLVVAAVGLLVTVVGAGVKFV